MTLTEKVVDQEDLRSKAAAAANIIRIKYLTTTEFITMRMMKQFVNLLAKAAALSISMQQETKWLKRGSKQRKYLTYISLEKL
jgi:hypothetical protein